MSALGIRGLLQTKDLLVLPETALRSLPYRSVERGAVTREVVTHFLRLADAFWRHDGNPTRPHASLTSGLCSDGFVDVLRLLKNARVAMLFARELVYRLSQAGFTGPFDWVVGSDHAGASISLAVAVELGALHDFTEKVGIDWNETAQAWRRFQIGPDQTVIQCEDIITTAGTLDKVRQGVVHGNGGPVAFAPVVLSVVNRSGQDRFRHAPIISLADYDMRLWHRSECPLCAVGSPRLRPKSDWRKLTGAV